MSFLRDERSKRVFTFLVFGGLFLLCWNLVYEFYLKDTYLNTWISLTLTETASTILAWMGHHAYVDQEGIAVGIWIDGTALVEIGAPCNGLSLIVTFTAFILAFPGPLKHKLWFIPVGILAIHLINIIRVTALTLIFKYSPEVMEFNHTYTFTILVYAFIFYLWFLWTSKLVPVLTHDKNK